MKFGRILATFGITATLVAGLVSIAAAQNSSGSLLPGQGARIGKQGPPTRGNQLGKQQNPGARQNDPDAKLIRKTANECQRAHKVMQSALPIYHGHRHKAMELTRIAAQEIRLGLRQNRQVGNTKVQSLQSQLKAIQNVPEDDPARYPKGQVLRSNKKMEAALKILGLAKTDLSQVTKDYNGHKANALTAIDMAIAEINLALSSINK